VTAPEPARPETTSEARADVRNIRRPHRKLLLYYALISLLWLPLFPIVFLPMFFRYRTLRYEFGDDGIAMSWGVLFRREIHLTYARIQDIHLRSNVLERWLGLARVPIQTASGSAKAEMIIVGVLEFEELRDFIYQHMRGVANAGTGDAASSQATPGASRELTSVLDSVAEELREIRALLQQNTAG
jgi:putative membrane protein